MEKLADGIFSQCNFMTRKGLTIFLKQNYARDLGEDIIDFIAAHCFDDTHKCDAQCLLCAFSHADAFKQLMYDSKLRSALLLILNNKNQKLRSHLLGRIYDINEEKASVADL
ncbi:MAG: hypothetical protein K8I29_01980 [Alphaproteobacteria bacterium]|uniref:Uncharacterized protein n=1 Tax=Candidatus Nitrobium versatile TaxID=2884831 RepID=A0A953M0V6_9BACT|nr:hypothetical protein [Candidatus Nitrobium versatile]